MVMCANYCDLGYQFDDSGCQTCACISLSSAPAAVTASTARIESFDPDDYSAIWQTPLCRLINVSDELQETSGVFRILERGPRAECCRRREGRSALGAEGKLLGVRSGIILQFSERKMVCFDALWNTVLKLMCLHQKASHQTSMHCACRFVVKVRVRGDGGASPNAPAVSTPLPRCEDPSPTSAYKI